MNKRAATLLGLASVIVTATALESTGAEPAEQKLELIPENQQLWTESMLWVKDFAFRAGLGYKDNIGLSPSDPRGSGFFTSGLDLAVQRLPLDGLAVTLMVTGDDTRYWHNVGINGEDFFIASAQLEKELGLSWKLGGEVRESYIDQIQYVLENTGPAVAEIKGNILEARPFVRRELGTNWWLRFEVPVDREFFGAPLDNCWRVGPRFVLSRVLGAGSSLTLTYGIFYEQHDTRLATDAQGHVVPGEKLTLVRNRADLAWERYWDRQRRWRAITKLGFVYSDDNGAGFYNFYGYFLSQEVRFQTREWQFRLVGRIGYEDFPVQTVDPTLPGSPRLYRAPLDITFHAERRLYKSLRFFAEYELEASGSNLEDTTYHANRVAGGLSWEF